MKKFILGLFIFGLASQVYSQPIPLPEVELTAVHYKYLNAVDTENTALTVKMLQEKVASYDMTKSDLYDDEYDIYTVTFYIPDGKILAAYDKSGNLIRTIEKFNDVMLPLEVRNSIANRFPNWAMKSDVYRVNYHSKKGVTKKQYTVKITNGDIMQKIKVNEDGEFL